MKRSRPTHDWITIVGEAFRCERCGATHVPPLPMAIKAFVRTIEAFVELHKHCKGATP